MVKRQFHLLRNNIKFNTQPKMCYENTFRKYFSNVIAIRRQWQTNDNRSFSILAFIGDDIGQSRSNPKLTFLAYRLSDPGPKGPRNSPRALKMAKIYIFTHFRSWGRKSQNHSASRPKGPRKVDLTLERAEKYGAEKTCTQK